MLTNALANQERFLFARIKKRKPLVSFSQLGGIEDQGASTNKEFSTGINQSGSTF
jgi:hypothetical protein